MLNLKRNSLLALFMMYFLLVGAAHSSAFAITNVYLNNTLNPGHPINASQSQSTAEWVFTALFNASGNQPDFTVLNSSVMNYRESDNKIITASYPIEITVKPNPEAALYLVNGSKQVSVGLFSSNVTFGTVYQGQPYQNATPAPACSQNFLYTEWDLFVSVQPNVLAPVQNIVVGRVCIYNRPIGSVSILPSVPVSLFSGNLTLNANGQDDVINISDNGTYGVSSDGLVAAHWNGGYIAGATPPNGSQYVAVNDSQNNVLYLQNIGTYQRWYSQYYKYAQIMILPKKQSYSPTSIGILSNSCNLISSTDLTNKSVVNTVNCMNQTATLYYSLSNQLSTELMQSGENLSGYSASQANFSSMRGFAIGLPSGFTSNPKITFMVNGQFLGYVISGTGSTPYTNLNASVSSQIISDVEGGVGEVVCNSDGVFTRIACSYLGGII